MRNPPKELPEIIENISFYEKWNTPQADMEEGLSAWDYCLFLGEAWLRSILRYWKTVAIIAAVFLFIFLVHNHIFPTVAAFHHKPDLIAPAQMPDLEAADKESDETPMLILPAMRFCLPIEGVNLAEIPSSRLPNAPRNYRHGTHGGIDFYIPYGTPIRAVADGIVTRADSSYVELDEHLHTLFLDRSEELQDTPPDVFERLKGRCIVIDHGFHDGFRFRSIYAHLSEVAVEEGAQIHRGEYIGNVGNSGTTAGVEGSHEDAHLHLEIRLQSPGMRESYLGQGLNESLTRKLLHEVFQPCETKTQETLVP